MTHSLYRGTGGHNYIQEEDRSFIEKQQEEARKVLMVRRGITSTDDELRMNPYLATETVDALTTTIIKNTVDEVIELMKMEGLEHKLTPFQETVNTYIKNRGEEIKQILSDITTKE